MTNRINQLLAALLLSALTAAALAQDPKPAAPPETPGDQPATLDDLLDIPQGETDRQAAEAAERDQQEQLKRALSQEEINDALREAVEKMGLSAEQLGQKLDSGLGTQRVQEDILAKLQSLIDAAQSQSSSSSSSKSKSSSGQQPSPQNTPQKGQQNPGQPSNPQKGDNQQEGVPPALREGDVNTVIEEGRHEWGSLPQRVRDMMMQGSSGKYSSLYQKLTQEYYKRLAEDGTN